MYDAAFKSTHGDVSPAFKLWTSALTISSVQSRRRCTMLMDTVAYRATTARSCSRFPAPSTWNRNSLHYTNLVVRQHVWWRWCCCTMLTDNEESINDVLFIAGLVAYWPARIQDVALLDLYCPRVTSGRLAVCYSQRRSIFSSATAFTTAKLRWQQSRYRTINGKKLKPAILWA